MFYAVLRAGSTVAAEGLADRGSQPGLLSSAERLADRAKGIDTGVGQLASGAETYAGGGGCLPAVPWSPQPMLAGWV